MPFTRRDFTKAAVSGIALAQVAHLSQLAQAAQSVATAPPPPTHRVKWSYMDHWTMRSPRGWVTPQMAPRYADRFYKAIVGVGYKGVDCFDFRLNQMIQMFGSAKAALQFAQDRGVERFPTVFGNGGNERPDLPETHDAVVKSFEDKIKLYEGVDIDNFVVMPGPRYWLVEPVTDEKLKRLADCWNRVGRVTAEHGIKLSCHHEFYCCVHTRAEIDKFYEYADPRYVGLWIDTAQHTIAGIDPTDLYVQYHDRVRGFHFKDTHYVDTRGDYRTPPDPERVASTTYRWFWEMGTPEGLVDFPKLMKALKDFHYTGWLTVEIDKADIGGANYADSACKSKWYIDNVLSKIYA